MKSFVASIVLLTSLTSNYSIRNRHADSQADPVLGTCEQVASDLAKYKEFFTTWGQTLEGDPQSSTQYRSTDGESFSMGTTIFKSKSRFKKSVQQIHELNLTSTTPLLDEKGQQVGERLLREIKLNGKVISVHIWRITDRMIQGISAPSLRLAVAAEKANFFCREALERSQTNR